MGIKSSLALAKRRASASRARIAAQRDVIMRGGGFSSGFDPSFGTGGFESGITVSGIPGIGTVSGSIPGLEFLDDLTIELGDPSLPGIPDSSFAPSGGDGCLPFFSRDPITDRCVFDADPGAGTGLPGGGDAAGIGLIRPRKVSRSVLDCPTFPDGRKGILWMNALTGDVVCLPRRTSGKGFGLIRKNPPRAKPFISAAENKLLTKISSVQKRAKTFATKAGFSCKKK